MLWFGLHLRSSAVGLGFGPGVLMGDMAFALVVWACRGFLRLCDAAGLSSLVATLAPRFLATCVWVSRVGFGVAQRSCGLHLGIPSPVAEYVGVPCLSLIRVFIKKFISGSGGFSFVHSAHLIEPGTFQHLFFVYTPMSRTGFPVRGHFMWGWVFILFHILSSTKGFIYPRAFFSNATPSA